MNQTYHRVVLKRSAQNLVIKGLNAYTILNQIKSKLITKNYLTSSKACTELAQLHLVSFIISITKTSSISIDNL